MAENSKIEWTNHTFNPWRGCTHVHTGCANCYAEAMSGRNPKTLGIWGDAGTRVRASDAMWSEPLKWDKAALKAGERHRVFCASLADVFENWQGRVKNSNGQDIWIDRIGMQCFDDGSRGFAFDKRPLTMDDLRRDLFELIDATPNLDWLMLTKRPQNVRRMWDYSRGHVSQNDGDGIDAFRKNVWLLTSVSDQPSADALVPPLLGCRDLVPALGLSVEPLIGPLDLTRLHFADGSGFRNALTGAFLLKCKGVNGHPDFWAETQEPSRLPKVDWVIVGGESGSHARPMHPDWARSIRAQCQAAGVPFFFKQWGEWVPLDQSAECEHARDGGHNPGFHTFECDNCVRQRSDGVVYLNRDSCKCVSVYKFGKKAAGRVLDGRTWDEFPKVSVAQ